MAWALLRHPETGMPHLVAEGATKGFEERGWIRHDLPEGLDPNDPNLPSSLDELLAIAEAAPPALTEEEAAELKGATLEDALKKRNLPTTGTAAEKRAAVAEHDNPTQTDAEPDAEPSAEETGTDQEESE